MKLRRQTQGLGIGATGGLGKAANPPERRDPGGRAGRLLLYNLSLPAATVTRAYYLLPPSCMYGVRVVRARLPEGASVTTPPPLPPFKSRAEGNCQTPNQPCFYADAIRPPSTRECLPIYLLTISHSTSLIRPPAILRDSYSRTALRITPY